MFLFSISLLSLFSPYRCVLLRSSELRRIKFIALSSPAFVAVGFIPLLCHPEMLLFILEGFRLSLSSAFKRRGYPRSLSELAWGGECFGEAPGVNRRVSFSPHPVIAVSSKALWRTRRLSPILRFCHCEEAKCATRQSHLSFSSWGRRYRMRGLFSSLHS